MGVVVHGDCWTGIATGVEGGALLTGQGFYCMFDVSVIALCSLTTLVPSNLVQ